MQSYIFFLDSMKINYPFFYNFSVNYIFENISVLYNEIVESKKTQHMESHTQQVERKTKY